MWIVQTRATHFQAGANKSGMEDDEIAKKLIAQCIAIDELVAAKAVGDGKVEDNKIGILEAAHRTVVDNRGVDDVTSSRAKRKATAEALGGDGTPASSSSPNDFFETPEQFGRSFLDLVKKPEIAAFPEVPDMSLPDFLNLISCVLTPEGHDELVGIDKSVLIAIFNATERKITKFREELVAALTITGRVAYALFVAMDKYTPN
jgi:hypothetical protein